MESQGFSQGLGRSVRVGERFEDTTKLALKMEEGAGDHRTLVASRSWKMQGKIFFPQTSRMGRALWKY